MSSMLVRHLVAGALVLIAAAPATAQYTTGEVSGYVRDATGAVVPGASVTIDFPLIAYTRTVTTDTDGYFAFPGVPNGTATVKAELQGFRPAERREARSVRETPSR